MTITQIQYFTTLARYLNFTKASEKMYITQSALSRQIAAIEKELNMQLFVRTHHSVRLTPAGQSLYERLKNVYNEYKNALSDARAINEGYNQKINIGLLDGCRVGDFLAPALKTFSEKHQNVSFQLFWHSFNGLVEGLYDGTLDLAITLYFDVKDKDNISCRVLEKSRDHLVVSSHHPLAGETSICLADIKEDPFIIVDTDDSLISGELIIADCKRQGFYPKVMYSPSIHTSMLWIQAGLGVGILDTRNILYETSVVKFLDIEPLSDPSLTLAWLRSNEDPVTAEFADMLVIPH